jgi:hypothetical protein
MSLDTIEPAHGIGHVRVHPNDLRDHFSLTSVEGLVELLKTYSSGETAFVIVSTSAGTLRLRVPVFE